MYVPPVIITGAAIGDAIDASPIPPAGLSIDQSQRIVRFDFASLDFVAPDRNKFAYRLRGFDPDWIDNDTRHTATYTNLPAGDYDFDVRGSNGNGIWNNAGTSMHLRVNPPWWATTIMKAGYVAILLGLLGFLWVAYRERRQRELQYHRELREREDRLRLALWGSGDEFWDWDMPARVIHRLGNARDGGGRTERTVSTDEWRNNVVHPEDLPFVERSINEHILGDSEFFEIEHRMRESDDNWIWVLSRGKVVERDENGRATARVRHRARHHRRAAGRTRTPHRFGSDRQHERSGQRDRSRFQFRRRQSRVHAHVRLSGNRRADQAGDHPEFRAAFAGSLQRDAPVIPRQRPLAWRVVAEAQERRGIPKLDRSQRSARCGRTAHALRRRDQRHHRTQARRTGTALSRQLRHVDRIAESRAARRASRARGDACAAHVAQSRRAVPRHGSFQARQRFDGSCDRRSRAEIGRRAFAIERARRRHGGAAGRRRIHRRARRHPSQR